ncbi:12603_t:CDS:2, partial [Entrophospora sp. SA101]
SGLAEVAKKVATRALEPTVAENVKTIRTKEKILFWYQCFLKCLSLCSSEYSGLHPSYLELKLMHLDFALG